MQRHVVGIPFSFVACLLMLGIRVSEPARLRAQEPLETSLVQTSKSVLPLQAVRFRLTWKNVGLKKVSPQVNLDRSFGIWEIKRPGDGMYTRLKFPVLDASGVIACGVRPKELDESADYK